MFCLDEHVPRDLNVFTFPWSVAGLGVNPSTLVIPNGLKWTDLIIHKFEKVEM
jgi:hypothetical protein